MQYLSMLNEERERNKELTDLVMEYAGIKPQVKIQIQTPDGEPDNKREFKTIGGIRTRSTRIREAELESLKKANDARAASH